MKLKFRITLLLAMLINVCMFAQDTYTLTGKVVSQADKESLPGVSVRVQNTSSGTETDFDGNYTIQVKSGAVLEFAYLGYTTQLVTITDQKTLNISMVEDANELDEIVVVGYGSRKKSDITGAVASVTEDELNAFPVLNAAQALQGRAAGVVVQSNNGGEPGAPISIKIRGNTSINASSAPLIVVDGFVGASMPQANDIKSLEVLKDASATAIYGSRGSNGVVLVTTKKGRSGKLVVDFNTTYAVQNTSNKLDLLNANEFADYQNQVAANQGSGAYVQGSEDTDWQDLIYTAGNTSNNQLSFSGGSDTMNFYASANYFNQEGIVVNSGFERATFLSNIDAQVSDKLKVGMNLFGSRGVKNGVPTQTTGSVTVGGDDVIASSFRFAPDLGLVDANGAFTTNSVGDAVDNPYAVATERVNERTADNFRLNTYLNYDILKNLSFKSTFGFSSLNETEGTFLPSTLIITASQKGGQANISSLRRSTVLSENYLTYTKELGKGNLTLLAGYSYQKNTSEFFSAGATGFPSNSVSFHNLGSGAVDLESNSSLNESEIQSQFARVNYDYNDKYLFTATVRRDGASNFAANEKYAIFPSTALGWKISNEEFLKNSETVSNLKLRASYGLTGNQAISPYQSLASYQAIYASTNGSTVNAVTPFQPANPDLKWETSYQTNIGVDLGLLNNKVSLSLDYYNIDTKDLILANTGLPEYFGFLGNEILANIGEINNSGFEVSLNTRNISNDTFTWTTDFNLSFNKNEVVSLIDGKDLFGSGAPSYFSIEDTYILREGEAVGLFWGLEYAGVYQGGAIPAGTFAASGSPLAGDPLFTDVDGDGAQSSADQKIIGDPNPDFTFGITNNFTYKNFDLNIFIQGSQGGDIFNMTNVQLYNGDANTTRDYFNSAWTSSNTNTNTPAVGRNIHRETSSRFVEDGSYIRLKNIALGYNFTSDVVEKLGLDDMRLSISAQNLLTITDYSGLDPEVNFFGGSGANNLKRNTAQGFDFGNYPTVQSFNIALNVKF